MVGGGEPLSFRISGLFGEFRKNMPSLGGNRWGDTRILKRALAKNIARLNGEGA